MADAFDFGDVDHALRETSVLIPVPTLDTPAAELDSLDTLATRFACDFRSKLPCVTRRSILKVERIENKVTVYIISCTLVYIVH